MYLGMLSPASSCGTLRSLKGHRSTALHSGRTLAVSPLWLPKGLIQPETTGCPLLSDWASLLASLCLRTTGVTRYLSATTWRVFGLSSRPARFSQRLTLLDQRLPGTDKMYLNTNDEIRQTMFFVACQLFSFGCLDAIQLDRLPYQKANIAHNASVQFDYVLGWCCGIKRTGKRVW